MKRKKTKKIQISGVKRLLVEKKRKDFEKNKLI